MNLYLYDETREREGEKGGARGLDQIVMKDRGSEAGNCRQARVPPGWTPKWLLTHHIYQPGHSTRPCVGEEGEEESEEEQEEKKKKKEKRKKK